jgi:hypothetical protein
LGVSSKKVGMKAASAAASSHLATSRFTVSCAATSAGAGITTRFTSPPEAAIFRMISNVRRNGAGLGVLASAITPTP